jgi:hypothetical protein
MIRAFTPSVRRSALALLAVFAGASCDKTNTVTAPIDTPAAVDGDSTAANDSITVSDSTAASDSTAGMGTTGDSVALVDSLATASAVSYSGLPYGPIGLWAGKDFEWGPGPFTSSQDNTYANMIVTRINTARLKRQRLVLAMTGGPSTDFTTRGKFDFGKWKNRMNTFKTTTIRNAVAAGVADGTIIGNTMIDEPETPKWGGVVTKSLIDQMATYVKNIFPTLPVGINMGGGSYRWRTAERFHKLDYVLSQYMWSVNSGNIGAWRDAVLSRARTDGVKAAFSLNLLNGGVKDRSGTWDCPGTGGKGTRYPNCRMTADQVSSWGRAIGPSGCFMAMWRYDDAFMSKSANQTAFRNVASLMATKPRQSCRRP